MNLYYNRRLNHFSNINSSSNCIGMMDQPVIKYPQAGYLCPEVTPCGKFDSTRFTEVSKKGHQSVNNVKSLATWTMHHEHKIPYSKTVLQMIIAKRK